VGGEGRCYDANRHTVDHTSDAGGLSWARQYGVASGADDGEITVARADDQSPGAPYRNSWAITLDSAGLQPFWAGGMMISASPSSFCRRLTRLNAGDNNGTTCVATGAA